MSEEKKDYEVKDRRIFSEDGQAKKPAEEEKAEAPKAEKAEKVEEAPAADAPEQATEE